MLRTVCESFEFRKHVGPIRVLEVQTVPHGISKPESELRELAEVRRVMVMPATQDSHNNPPSRSILQGHRRTDLFLRFATLPVGDESKIVEFFGELGAIPNQPHADLIGAVPLFGSRVLPSAARENGVDPLACEISLALSIQRQFANLWRFHRIVREKQVDAASEVCQVVEVAEDPRSCTLRVKELDDHQAYVDLADIDERTRSNPVLRLAAYVRHELNAMLFRSSTMTLKPSFRGPDDCSRMDFSITPVNLVGAFVCQFAQHLSSSDEARQCETCGKWFIVSSIEFRASKRYCSDACKMKGYRLRKNLAKQMDQQGLPIEEIAKELGVEAKTVRGWIKPKASSKKPTSRARRKPAE
jgi:hypothetical protein